MERMIIEVTYKANIHGPNTKKPGATKLLYKNKKKKALIDTGDIKALINYHGLDGKLAKDRCEIVHAVLGNIIIDMPYEQVSDAMRLERFVVRGYKQYKEKK